MISKNILSYIVYIGKKAITFVLSILVLSFIVFYVAHYAPGDPLAAYYGDRVERISPAERAWAEERLGLHQPVYVQYIRWLDNALHGEFGISFQYKKDVLEVVNDRIGNTLLLGGISFLLTSVLSLFVGILCAWFEDKLLDRLLCQVGVITSCIPEFWLSLVLILIFAVQLQLLPSSGAYAIDGARDIGDRVRHLILPMMVVVFCHLWYFAYMVRNKILEEVRADYVLLAKAKGLNRYQIMFGHCLPNVLPSYLSLIAVSVHHILGGTYIVEMVFSYPGIGTLSYESARYQDYNLLMVLCILSGTVVILCNMAAQAVNNHIYPGGGRLGE